MIPDLADRHVLDRIGGFLEKERRLPRRVRTHFARMRGVVAADAIDAAHRKYVGFADDGNRGDADRKNRFRAGLRGRRAALRRGARERQRAGGENGPAIDGIHARSPRVFLLFDGVSSLPGYARQANPDQPPATPPAHDQGRRSPFCCSAMNRSPFDATKSEGPRKRGPSRSGSAPEDQCLISGGSLPPFAANFIMICLCNQIFMVAESLLSPV